MIRLPANIIIQLAGNRHFRSRHLTPTLSLYNRACFLRKMDWTWPDLPRRHVVWIGPSEAALSAARWDNAVRVALVGKGPGVVTSSWTSCTSERGDSDPGIILNIKEHACIPSRQQSDDATAGP